MKVIPPCPENILQVGRTITDGDTLFPVQSGSGCRFMFSGRRLCIVIGCGKDIENSAPFCNKPRFAVTVNGVFIVKKVAETAEEEYTIIDSDTPVDAEVCIIKLSEAAFSVGTVRILADTDAVIRPAQKLPYRIEFIGDSITCAYGVDDSNTQSEFATEAENAMKSYACKAAGLLGAEYSLFSYSGHGIISGWTDTGERNTREIIVPYYRTAGFSYAAAAGRRTEDIPWENTMLPCDVVTVNLGTNDASYCKAHPQRREEFRKAYTDFLRTLRSFAPDAYIIASLGIMNHDLMPEIEAAAEELRNEGDSRISAFSFTEQDGMLGYGSNWHPSAETHLRAAGELAAFIREKGILQRKG